MMPLALSGRDLVSVHNPVDGPFAILEHGLWVLIVIKTLSFGVGS